MSERKKLRDRKPNFTDSEIQCLLMNIIEERDIVHSKINASLTVKKKQLVWDKITANVNACNSAVVRNEQEVRKKWKDLKSAVLNHSNEMARTGGGCAPKEPPFKDLVLYIIGEGSDMVEGIEG